MVPDATPDYFNTTRVQRRTQATPCSAMDGELGLSKAKGSGAWRRASTLGLLVLAGYIHILVCSACCTGPERKNAIKRKAAARSLPPLTSATPSI